MVGIRKTVKKKPRINKNLKCALCEAGVKEASYKDIYRINKFITRRGKILPRVRTGTCSHHQVQLSRAIKNARYMALLPYASNV